jgi:DNA mismatch repair protein MSH4
MLDCHQAWSIAEALISKRAHTLFATHMQELVELESVYANVKNHHLMVESHNDKLVYHYQIGTGSSSLTSYGIKLAALVGFPLSLLQDAEQTRQVLESHKRSLDQAAVQRTNVLRAAYDLVDRLKAVAQSTVEEHQVLEYLMRLKSLYATGADMPDGAAAD